jgi:hypothetical protein
MQMMRDFFAFQLHNNSLNFMLFCAITARYYEAKLSQQKKLFICHADRVILHALFAFTILPRAAFFKLQLE